jgi:glycosyltransferase involved in cell wall biosynthesis
MDVFAFSKPAPPGDVLQTVAFGRTSRAKGYVAMIRAIDRLRGRGRQVNLRIIGPSATSAEAAHRAELHSLIEELALASAVTLELGVPRDDVPRILATSDMLLNGMVAGSGDKAVFESLAVGRPAIASNPAFAPLFDGLPVDLSFEEGSAESLADRMEAIADLGSETRLEIASILRHRVEDHHSLDHWSATVVEEIDASGRHGD